MKARGIILSLAVGLALVGVTLGQQVKMSALPVTRSDFVDKLKKLKASNPKATTEELLAAANDLVDKDGIPFAISFDAATCERLRKVKEQQKDPNAPLRLGATLKSVDADGAALSLPEPKFAAKECGDCFVELPLLSVTDKDFITKVLGQNIRFQLPANFFTNDVLLLSDDGKAIKRRWRVPFASVPIGVSYDENVVYLSFPETELSDLAIAVFGEGVFQISSRSEAEASGKASALTESFTAGQNKLSIAKFQQWEKKFLIAYKPPC